MASAVHNGLQLVPFGSAGAPSAGTWAAGTLMCDSGGAMYRCTVGGTPGTWVAIPAAGSVSISSCEVDFGVGSFTEGRFVVTDAAVTATSKIILMQSGLAPTGREADENEFDVFRSIAIPAAGSFTLTVYALRGPVNGKYKFNYILG